MTLAHHSLSDDNEYDYDNDEGDCISDDNGVDFYNDDDSTDYIGDDDENYEDDKDDEDDDDDVDNDHDDLGVGDAIRLPSVNGSPMAVLTFWEKVREALKTVFVCVSQTRP